MINDLTQELSTNFIDYAYAVNTDRAIPDAKSGLKPVAKRILWSAFEEGRTSSKPHVKAARIVGDVMGRYHPHGDSSIYSALIRLSQNWIMRYPLIDVHGNNGNIAGDGPAAARYTEARLTKLAEEGLLNGIKKKNVDFIQNYDETLDEPVTLPSIFPNLLCNPNTGIGVAMACNWAPHNLNDVTQAILDFLDGNVPTLPGPDFPTGGLIINKNDIPKIMETGHGSVKIRARYNIEKDKIIFYEIPYGQTIEGLISEVGDKCDKKEFEEIIDIHDESNKKGIRIVIQFKNGSDPHTLARKLYQKTNFQTSFSYNQVALIDKTPTELNLKDAIKIYVKHNLECIVKECKFDLTKAENRLETVNGLLKALEDIDNIIVLIKKSDNATAAKQSLIEKYNFTENQAKAILAMRLSSLAKLEKVELEKEAKELENKITDLENILSSEERQKSILKSRLSALVKKYGDERRTELTQIDVKPEEKVIEEVIPEDVVVILTQTGDIKRVPAKSFKVQRKGGKGIKSKNEIIMSMISTNTIDNLLIFTKKGKMFKILVDDIPSGTNASKGVHVGTLIKMELDDEVIAIASLVRGVTAKYVIFFTKQGLMKKTKFEEYTKIKRGTGITAIKINPGDSIANVEFMDEENVLVVTKNGMAIYFESKNVAPIGRIAAGVKTIKLAADDEVLAGIPIKSKDDVIAFISSKGYGKKTSINEFTIQGRGGKGVIIYKPSPVYGHIAGVAAIKDKDKLFLTGQPNSICISVEDLPQLSRTSFGNTIIKSTISSIVRF